MTDERKNMPGEAGWWDGTDPEQGSSGIDDEAALDRLRALGAAPNEGDDELPLEEEPKRRFRRPKPASAKQAWGRMAGRVSRGGSGTNWGRLAVRIAAPAVFLVAVIVLVMLVFQSGIIGSQSEQAVAPSPSASSPKAGAKSTTKVYVVKQGDTLSGIAVKFNTSISVIEELNPNLRSSTLVAGARIKVPRNP